MAKGGKMARQKVADEIFCRSCGEPIKEQAEICPHCGVRNQKSQSDTSTRTSSSKIHDPSQYETTVSDSWWYGVAGGTALWILTILLSGVLDSLGAFGGLLLIAAWIGMPVSAYFDMQYIRANGNWNPNTIIWVVVLSVWLINIIAGLAYLYRRHDILGEP